MVANVCTFFLTLVECRCLLLSRCFVYVCEMAVMLRLYVGPRPHSIINYDIWQLLLYCLALRSNLPELARARRTLHSLALARLPVGL